MTAQNACCCCDSITMGYGRQKVLSSCTLEVSPGEVVGLVGENGTGKTTLVKGLLGFLPLRGGSVAVTAPVGFCPQENFLNRSLTVHEHLRFIDAIGRRYAIPNPAYQEHLLQETRLSTFLHTSVGALSGGTYQKVKFVTAIWNRPALLVLDEPCDGFDWQMYLLFWQLLGKLTALGTGILMVSHLIHDWERFQRIYTLKEGTLAVS